MRFMRAAAVVGLVLGLISCGGSSSVPSAPTAVQQAVSQPTAVQLSGLVVDTANRAIAGARVDVLSGPQTGASTSTDAGGRFSLTGIFDGTARFQASKDGYIVATQPLTVSSPVYGLVFVLESLAAPANVAGDYTLTFIADSACADQLPADMRTRTHPATIRLQSFPNRPGNTTFMATVDGSTFDGYYRQMLIAVAGDYLTFDLSDNFLLEEVADETYFAIGGVGGGSVGAAGASTITASFQGTFDYCVMNTDLVDGSRYNCTPDVAVAHAQCAAKNHRLILTRR